MPGSTLISGCAVLADGGFRPEADLLLEGGRIRKVGSRLKAKAARRIDGRGLLAAPGLIDTQINGGFGFAFSETGPEEVLEVGKKLLAHGVTGYLPTLISLPKDVTVRGLRSLVAASKLKGGAEILGIHMEGPFLAPERRGAHMTGHLRKPSVAEFETYRKEAKGLLRMMTLAPELPGALEVVKAGTRRGIVMSGGHSQASAAQVSRAVVEGGLRHITHVFNAMPSFHHREETIANAALLIDRLSCGFIYDRQHVSSGAAILLIKAKPPGSLVLVSDAVFAMGAPDGEIRHDGETYVVGSGQVRVKSTQKLAGSACSILEGVRCLIADTQVPPSMALSMASAAPAALLGLERKGVLRPGADADLVLFDKGFRVRATIVGGEVLYEA